jgi:hypothetical protein
VRSSPLSSPRGQVAGSGFMQLWFGCD